MPDLLTLHAKIKALHPALRDPSNDEVLLFGEALAAGAVLNPRTWREYLTTGGVLPVQWEGTVVRFEDTDNPVVVAAVETKRASRDAYLARVRSGDLRAVADRISGAALGRAA